MEATSSTYLVPTDDQTQGSQRYADTTGNGGDEADYIASGVNRAHEDGSTVLPKFVMIGLHAGSIAFASWVLLGGVTTLNERWTVRYPTRARCMLVCLVLVWIKHAVSLKWLIKRKVQWDEALPLALFSLPVEVGTSSTDKRPKFCKPI